MENKNWLVFANREKCHHAEALHELGFVNWSEKNVNMNVGDIVYLYMSDERCVRFKTQVIAKDCPREDEKYWQVTPPEALTCKLKLIAEYKGNELNDNILKEHNFKGGKSIQNPTCNNNRLFSYIDGIFSMNSYAHIIDNVVPQEKSRELVRQMIPILIRWAKQGITTKTYGDLTNELGYKRFSGIGNQLGYIDDVLKNFEDLTGKKVPTLNALVKSKSTELPSPGFSHVYTSYDSMSYDEKKIFVMGLNKEAIEYKDWDWVLSSLQLTPSIINIAASEEDIRSGKFYGAGGEGKNHRMLKEHVFKHPEMLGIKDIKLRKKEMEYTLLSGDRLDVFFELNDGSKIAIEIKPASSSEADIMRGLFQCVKYKSILDAEDKVHGDKSNNATILVLGGKLSEENRRVQETLGVEVKEDFPI